MIINICDMKCVGIEANEFHNFWNTKHKTLGLRDQLFNHIYHGNLLFGVSMLQIDLRCQVIISHNPQYLVW